MGPGGLWNPFTQAVKVSRIDGISGCGTRTGHEQFTQLQAILVLAYQLTHILAAGAVASLADLHIHESLQGCGQGNVHGAHTFRIVNLAKIGKMNQGSWTFYPNLANYWLSCVSLDAVTQRAPELKC
jgi:hypothetical protein